MAEDIELLRRYVADRSEAAFAALVHQHLPLVYHAALRRTNGDMHLAEEIAQTVFANLAREAVTLQRHAALTGWLYVATRHAAANAMRTEQRRKARELEAHNMNEPTIPASSGAEWEQLRPQIDSVMDELSEKDREAVLLRFFENRPYAEIGASFRITEDAARMRVDRALDKLRSQLTRRGITSTAVALGGLLAAQSAVAAPAGLATAVAGSVLASAGAAAAGTSTAGFIAFMTTNKIVMGITAGVVLIAGGTAIHGFREARRAETALLGLGRDLAALESQLARTERERLDLDEKKRVAEEQLADLTKRAEEADVTKGRGPVMTAGSGSSGSKPLSAASFAGKMDVLYANPEYIRLELEKAALGLGFRYGRLYRKLGLADTQIREFEALMLEQQQSMFDVFASARSSGVSINDPSLRQLQDPAQAAVQEKLRALLGPEGFAEYKEYGKAQTGIARSSVDNLAMRLYTSATPITPDQSDRLIRIIAANTPKSAGPGLVMDATRPDWEVVYAQAKEVLSPPQLAALADSNRVTAISIEQAQLSDRLLQEAAVGAAK